MVKFRLKVFSLLLLLAITSCKQTLTSSNESLSSETISLSSEPVTSAISDSTSPEISSSEVVPSLDDDAILYEYKYFHSNYDTYGATNGNANNNGMVVYDHTREKHYFAVGNSVYAFDPKVDTTTVLFSYLETGHIQNLCLLDDDLYFVMTQTNFLYRYNLSEKTTVVVYEEETNKVYGYDSTIFANIKRANYLGEMEFGLGTYNHRKKEVTTKFNLGTTLVNINSRRLYYNENYGLTLKLMADAFNGKTNLHYFSETTFEEMTAIQLFDVSIDAIQILRFALLLTGGGTTSLYLFSTDDNSLLKISELANIHSINSDDEYIYFISENNLYRYDVAQNKLLDPIHLFLGAKYTFVLNHWLYFSNASLTTLYRIHPITKAITTDFWL